RDPLVEYKVEAARMFDDLLRSIQSAVAHTIYHVSLVQQPARPRPQRMVTNRAEETTGPTKAAKKVGRNDPCPCGSGKKYKFCHGRAA
ncbi:MAG: preprotein translocase subunit SecA, partial [Chloroflexota bacterium]|nr:preprotein translocase subunit SecA [Chloroflexota bacterium]